MTTYTEVCIVGMRDQGRTGNIVEVQFDSQAPASAALPQASQALDRIRAPRRLGPSCCNIKLHISDSSFKQLKRNKIEKIENG